MIEAEEVPPVSAIKLGATTPQMDEEGDLAPGDNADLIYELCHDATNREEVAAHWEECGWSDDPKTKQHYAEKARRLREAALYTDISDDVCSVIEHELRGTFTGEGWRTFEYDSE